MRAFRGFLLKIRNRAFAPVDVAALVFFRIAFGCLMIWHVCKYFSNNCIARFWLEPRLAIKYYGFSWVHPWPGHGLHIHWAVLGVLALFIAVGFLYRASAALFCLGYTYTFLLDEALFVNHRYLICLLSFLLIFVPANCAFSIDAWKNPKIRSQTSPAWAYWLLRTQMGVVYFFAGVAKLSPDWRQGEPMRFWLARNADFPILGRFFREDAAVYAFSYASLLFDLSIVPLLLWRRTRVAAFCAALCFHLLNARLFSIGVFPWLAIAATTLFLSPSWPRRLLAMVGKGKPLPTVDQAERLAPPREGAVLALVFAYIAIQVLVPLYPFFGGGGIEWRWSERPFTWRMLLVKDSVHAYFYVTDPNSGDEIQSHPENYLKPWQIARMGWQPDMLLQYAQFLAKLMPRSGPEPLKVEARVYLSINGRKPELIIDPNVDLAAEARTLGRPRWVLQIHEPLPPAEQRLTADGLIHSPGDD